MLSDFEISLSKLKTVRDCNKTISSYTTTYSSGTGSENRNYNIALASSLLNNSICSANGGT